MSTLQKMLAQAGMPAQGTASALSTRAEQAPDRIESTAPGEVGTTAPVSARDSLLSSKEAKILAAFGMSPNKIFLVLERKQITGEPLDEILASQEFKFLDTEECARAQAEYSGNDYFDPANIESIDFRAIENFLAKNERVQLSVPRAFVPVAIEQAGSSATITIALSNSHEVAVANATYEGMGRRFVIASGDTIQKIYRRFFARTADAFDKALATVRLEIESPTQVPAGLDLSPIATLRMALLRHAAMEGVSDIKIFATRSRKVGMIEFKYQGEGQHFRQIPYEVYVRLTKEITRDVPKFDAVIKQGPIDAVLVFDKEQTIYKDVCSRYTFRLAVTPQDEKMHPGLYTSVIRVADTEGETTNLDALSFDEASRSMMLRAIEKTQGLIICTGPTGSGKTTTLYALLNSLDPTRRWIKTIENPIERPNSLIGQFQVPQLGDEAEGTKRLLKAALRSAPDVILVGEVRDAEVASTAVTAGGTGHLVFTSLHANDAAGTIAMLLKRGQSGQEIAQTLLLVIAQRLVRTLCDQCKVPDERLTTKAIFDRPEFKELGLGQKTLRRRGEGCPACRGQSIFDPSAGYKGRALVYELMPMSQNLRVAIEDGASGEKLREIGIQPNRSMSAVAMQLVAKGRLDIDQAQNLSGDLPWN